jgi:hypothetical protein
MHAHMKHSFQKSLTMLLSLVIKPGPPWWVDPGPSQPGGWSGSGLIKDWPGQRPGKTQST